MPATSISKLETELARVKSRKSAAMSKIETRAAKIQHTVLVGAAAYVCGKAEAGGTMILPGIFGLDPKLVWGLVSHVLGANAKGQWANVSTGVGDGLIGAYGYAEGLGKGHVISGEFADGGPEIQI